MFGEKGFNSNEMATSFRNSIWRQPPSSNSIIVLISDSTVAFNNEFATSPPSLVRIGQIVKEMQKLFAIQDGGSRHRDFWRICVSWRHLKIWWLCNSNVTIVFLVIVLTSPPNLVGIGLIVKKWQQLFGIKDNGRRRIEFCWMYIFNKMVAF